MALYRYVRATIRFAFGDLALEPHRVGKPLERELSGLFVAAAGGLKMWGRRAIAPRGYLE
jgi:mRNA interferase RelE/StbE